MSEGLACPSRRPRVDLELPLALSVRFPGLGRRASSFLRPLPPGLGGPGHLLSPARESPGCSATRRRRGRAQGAELEEEERAQGSPRTLTLPLARHRGPLGMGVCAGGGSGRQG